MNTTTARGVALEILRRWGTAPGPLQPVIDAVFARNTIEERDRALAVALVQETLRRLRDLDDHIAAASRHPLSRMRPLTLAALRLGLCQLLFFSAMPPSAAVDETVTAFKRIGQPRWLVAFVHGTLRTLARELPRLRQELTLSGGSHNHPSWLFERWRARLGADTALAICRANNTRPPLTVRVHRGKVDPNQLARQWLEAGIVARHCAMAPDCFALPNSTGPISGIPGYDAGQFHVQDEGAQLCCQLLAPLRDGGRYLDGCAGLGGKTATLAQLLPPAAELTAAEPEPRRFRLLGDNLARLGLTRQVECFSGTLEELAESNPSSFDGILLDVPCSGTGVIRRRPDIRWNRRPEELPSLARRQLALLETAAGLLLPGGVLVYVTCSMEPEENDEVVAAFLARHKDFQLTGAAAWLPPQASILVGADDFLRTTPLQDMDGFFAARMIRVAWTDRSFGAGDPHGQSTDDVAQGQPA